VQKAIEAPHVHFAVLGDRRNGVERLSLIGTLDRSTLTLLEDEVATVLLSADVSTVLSPGDGAWGSISLPPSPGQRGSPRHRIHRERSETC
jgi:hypothetical protein